jgi:hypothetical protein
MIRSIHHASKESNPTRSENVCVGIRRFLVALCGRDFLLLASVFDLHAAFVDLCGCMSTLSPCLCLVFHRRRTVLYLQFVKQHAKK